MRPIIFRGKTVGGFWVYGNLNILERRLKNIEAGYYISNSAGSPFAYQIIPETVGQYIGEKDLLGNNIFEGDVLCQRYYHNNAPSKRPKKNFIDVNRTVLYAGTGFILEHFSNIDYGTRYNFRWSHLTVLGNKFDNPELLNK